MSPGMGFHPGLWYEAQNSFCGAGLTPHQKLLVPSLTVTSLLHQWVRFNFSFIFISAPFVLCVLGLVYGWIHEFLDHVLTAVPALFSIPDILCLVW